MMKSLSNLLRYTLERKNGTQLTWMKKVPMNTTRSYFKEGISSRAVKVTYSSVMSSSGVSTTSSSVVLSVVKDSQLYVRMSYMDILRMWLTRIFDPNIARERYIRC